MRPYGFCVFWRANDDFPTHSGSKAAYYYSSGRKTNVLRSETRKLTKPQPRGSQNPNRVPVPRTFFSKSFNLVNSKIYLPGWVFLGSTIP